LFYVLVWWIINKKMWGAKLKFKIIKKKGGTPSVPPLLTRKKINIVYDKT